MGVLRVMGKSYNCDRCNKEIFFQDKVKLYAEVSSPIQLNYTERIYLCHMCWSNMKDFTVRENNDK